MLVYIARSPHVTIVTVPWMKGGGVSNNDGRAMDNFILSLRDRFLQLDAERNNLAPDLYDEYRAVASYIGFGGLYAD